MRRVALTLVALALTTGGAHADDGAAHADDGAASDATESLPQVELLTPRAKASVVGPNPAYIGQLSQVEVELLRDDRQQNKPAPFFPELQVRGAIALLSSTSPPPEVRDVGGVRFLVQKRRYLIFPQEPGLVNVPAVAISLPGPNDRPTLVSTKPVSIKADVPKGTGGRVPLVARDVRIERKIEGDLGSLRVGDAFTMTVELSASETDAVMLPTYEAPELEGVSRYLGQATTQTTAVRGAYQAKRIDTVTYVANDWGRYTLPRVAVFWLDPETGKYDEAVAPAVAFRARVNPSLGAGCVGGPQAVARTGGLIFLVMLVVFFGVRGWRRWAAFRASRARVQRTADEKLAFAALVRAAKGGGDAVTLTALYRWLRFVFVGVPTLERMRVAEGDTELTRATHALEARVVGESTSGNTTDLVAPLERYRRSTKPARSRRPLGPLN